MLIIRANALIADAKSEEESTVLISKLPQSDNGSAQAKSR